MYSSFQIKTNKSQCSVLTFLLMSSSIILLVFTLVKNKGCSWCCWENIFQGCTIISFRDAWVPSLAMHSLFYAMHEFSLANAWLLLAMHEYLCDAWLSMMHDSPRCMNINSQCVIFGDAWISSHKSWISSRDAWIFSRKSRLSVIQ